MMKDYQKKAQALEKVLESVNNVDWLADEGSPKQVDGAIRQLKRDIEAYERASKSKLRKVF